MAKKSSEKTLQKWIERDLTAAARSNELPPAFEIEEPLQQVRDILLSGKNPVITGESGVGKSALIYELVRRSVAGSGPDCLTGKRILQFSFRHRAAALKDTNMMRPQLQKLMDALFESNGEIVPFFRDIHLGYSFDLESQLQALAFRYRSPILGEGEGMATLRMFEYEPELSQNFVTLTVEEPGLEKASRLLVAWAGEQEKTRDRRYDREALDEALHLSHRFLARANLPRKAIELLVHAASFLRAGEKVDAAHIIDRFCQSHRVPRALVDPAIPLDLASLDVQFSDRVLGQEEAVKAVIQMVGLIKAGMADVRRPFGVFLFVGPTGVGKTHLAQLLAEYLFGSPERMLRLNMADYPNESDPEVLFGNPDANSLPIRRGVLTQRIAGRPFAVLLLDELEKAHQKIHDRLLQLFDEGVFINGAGESISCRSMIIIATSNAGTEVYRGQALGFTTSPDMPSLDKEVDRRLNKHFRFEFLNRFDRVVHFHPLTREHIRTIAQRELEQLKDRGGLKRRGFVLEVDEVVLDWLAAHGYDPHYGARFLRRTIEKHVTSTLAEVMVRAGEGSSRRISLSVHHNRVVARLIERPPPGSRRETVILPLGTSDQVVRHDRSQLLSAAEELLEEARGRLEELDGKQTEASALLERMNEGGFWEKAEESRELLDKYRELDVSIQLENRWARPIRRLEELKKDALEGQANLNQLARGLELAASALREWEARMAEEGASVVWMVLSKIDPLLPASQWLTELTEMELAWCRKLGLDAAVVGYEALDQVLTRVAIEVEGPGAGTYLTMEEGIHRLYQGRGPDLRASIEIIPRAATVDNLELAGTPIKRRKGLFELELTCWGRLILPERGLGIEFVGGNNETLSMLLADLRSEWRMPPVNMPHVARAYGQDGAGARDPRTGTVVSRLKDVLKGDLDRFLEAWRQYTSSNPSGQGS